VGGEWQVLTLIKIGRSLIIVILLTSMQVAAYWQAEISLWEVQKHWIIYCSNSEIKDG